ncbi:MAG TPA: enoyl-CoA hydratase, partial [Polymorphobacter sp.]|nr:enoyl-CoA hydratase [Polymorphobacter sp.]
DAATAEKWGLVNRVFAADDLMPAARKLASEMAQVDTGFVRAYKRLIDDGYAATLGDGMALEHQRSSAANAAVTPGAVEAARLAVVERGRTQ